jgi:hypothetical protein
VDRAPCRALAAGLTVVFALTVGRVTSSRWIAVLPGLEYGAAVWAFMANAVLSLPGVAHEPIGGPYWWAFLADHAVFVGLPISVLTSRAALRPSR